MLDQAHLETLQQAPSLEAQRLSLHQPWYASEVHTQAQRVYTDALHTQGEAAFARADVAFLRAIRPEVAAYAEAAVRDVDHQIRTLELRACAANEDWVCILERTDPAEGGTSNDEWLRLSFQASAALLAEESNAVYAAHVAPPATRLAALRTALFHRQRLASMGLEDPEISVAQLEHQIEAQAAAEQASAARLQREQARRQAAEEAAAMRRQSRVRPLQSAPRHRSSCAVQCCDGTCSPSCTSAHRGCCSSHGGVCG